MSLKLLHIISDEKFPDAAYRQFEEVAPGASTFMLPQTKAPIRYLKEIVPVRVSKLSFLNPSFIKSLEKYDAVILHSMTGFALELIGRASRKTKFVWIGMGFDYYDLVYKNAHDMLEPETTTIVKETLPAFGRKGPRNPIKRLLRSMAYPNVKKKRELIQKVDLFCPVLPSESENLKSALGQFHPKTVPWNYGAQSSLIDNGSDLGWVSGGNILVGNSATPTNNHIEVFRILSRIPLPASSKIVVPLSYGDARYREKIVELGTELFGDQFQPVTDFMDFDQYAALLQSCSMMVMNHKRQQGAGNIGIGMYLGAKVFVNPCSPLYDYYKETGLTIYSLAELEQELSEGVVGLSADSASRNREILQRERGREAHLLKTEKLIAEIQALCRAKVV